MEILEVVKDFKIENDNVFIYDANNWLKGRENYIGGSESFAFGAEILNVNYRWNTPFTVWCNKSGFGIEKDSPAMKYGRQREPYILRMAENTINMQYAEKVQVFQSAHTYFMRDYPFIAANLDGIVELENGNLAGLEIKTSSYKYGWTETEIPFYYFNQIQHYMLVTGLEEFFVIAEVCGEKLTYRIQDDKPYQEQLLKKMIDFWAYVESKTKPEIMNVNCEKPYIKKLDEMLEEVLDIPELIPFAQEYCLVREQKLAAERRSKELAFILKNALKPGHKAKAGDYKVTCTIRSCTTLDTQKFKTTEPTMYEKFLTKTNREMLCVQEKKIKKTHY